MKTITKLLLLLFPCLLFAAEPLTASYGIGLSLTMPAASVTYSVQVIAEDGRVIAAEKDGKPVYKPEDAPLVIARMFQLIDQLNYLMLKQSESSQAFSTSMIALTLAQLGKDETMILKLKTQLEEAATQLDSDSKMISALSDELAALKAKRGISDPKLRQTNPPEDA